MAERITLKTVAHAASAAAQAAPGEPTPEQIVKAARDRGMQAKMGLIDPPISVFPKEIQDVVMDSHKVFGSPLDFYLGGILAAASIAIGNRFVAAYKSDNIHPANLYIVLIGTSGIGKSPTLKSMLAPIEAIEETMQTEYLQMLEKHRQRCFEWRNEKRAESEMPPAPMPPEILLQDAMLPSIQISLAKNRHGLLCWHDEVKGWISNLKGRHQTGDETSFWLSTFDTSFAKVTRQSRERVWLKQPFITVVGGIQPGVMRSLATGDHVDSGMFNRFLFCYPQSMEKAPDTNNDTDPNMMAFYGRVIQKMYDLPSRFARPTAATYEPEGLNDLEEVGENVNTRIPVWLTDEARKMYAGWKEANRKKRNAHALDDERLASIYDKQESFVLRFALILEFLKLATNMVKEEMTNQSDPWAGMQSLQNMEHMKISPASISGGIAISEYAESTSRRVLERFESPVNALPGKLRDLYHALDEEFKTASAKTAGEALGLSVRQVERMLEGGWGLVVKRMEQKQGWYKKLFF